METHKIIDVPKASPSPRRPWREIDIWGAAISGLGRIRVPEVVPRLGRALHHQNCRIRIGAVEVLGLRRGPEAMDLLIEALKHQDTEVVTKALSWLKKFPSPKLMTPLDNLRKFPPLGLSIELFEEVCRGLDQYKKNIKTKGDTK